MANAKGKYFSIRDKSDQSVFVSIKNYYVCFLLWSTIFNGTRLACLEHLETAVRILHLERETAHDRRTDKFFSLSTLCIHLSGTNLSFLKVSRRPAQRIAVILIDFQFLSEFVYKTRAAICRKCSFLKKGDMKIFLGFQ